MAVVTRYSVFRPNSPNRYVQVFDGGLDFPIPLAEDGVGVRFPLSGGFVDGTSTVSMFDGVIIQVS